MAAARVCSGFNCPTLIMDTGCAYRVSGPEPPGGCKRSLCCETEHEDFLGEVSEDEVEVGQQEELVGVVAPMPVNIPWRFRLSCRQLRVSVPVSYNSVASGTASNLGVSTRGCHVIHGFLYPRWHCGAPIMGGGCKGHQRGSNQPREGIQAATLRSPMYLLIWKHFCDICWGRSGRWN